MTDILWLASESKKIHEIFVNLFYGLTFFLLVLGVVLEYFKWPLGSIPQFSTLVGRALIAAILLHTFVDVLNFTGDITDALAHQLGNLNQLKFIRIQSQERLHALTWSMLSFKEGFLLLISMASFFLLYIGIYLAEASMIYTWTLLYVFSPLLIALFVLPATARATGALYRSMIEVSLWKIVWSVLATLLWSAALVDYSHKGADVNLITAVCFNLMFAFSLIATPKVVHALAGTGISSLAGGLAAASGGLMLAAGAKAVGVGSSVARGTYNASVLGASQMSKRFFPKSHQIIKKMPLIRTSQRPSFFLNQKSKKPQKTK